MHFTPINIYYGRDTYPIRRKIRLLQQSLAKSNDSIETVHYNQEASSQEIIARLETLNLTASRLILIVWNCEKIFQKNNLELFLQTVGSNFLFLVSAQVVWNKKPEGALTKLINSSLMITYQREDSVNYQTLKNRLLKEVDKYDFKITTEGTNYLIKYFQSKAKQNEDARVDIMKFELEKINLYFRKGSQLTPEKLAEIIEEIAEEKKEYDIINAFFARNKKQTLTNFLIFVQQSGNLASLVPILFRETTKLLQYQERLQRKEESETVLKDMGVRFSNQRTAMVSRNILFKPKQVNHIIKDLVKIDRILKTSSTNNPNVTKSNINLRVRLALEKMFSLRI